MPKILDSMREQLLLTARKQIEENGYANTTIRSVAAECGIAVGTVYNYFPSKDMLIATFISEDWRACMDAVRAYGAEDAETYLRRMYDALRGFAASYRTLFSDTEARKSYRAAASRWHGELRKQLASLILPVCCDGPDRDFLSEFIAESLLTWTMEGEPFENIYKVIEKLIQNKR